MTESRADDGGVDVFEYAVVSKWTGWGGGWGSESDIQRIVNNLAKEGFRLVRTESGRFFWFGFFLRMKVLMFFERNAFEDVDESAQLATIREAPRDATPVEPKPDPSTAGGPFAQ